MWPNTSLRAWFQIRSPREITLYADEEGLRCGIRVELITAST